jgi:hypothetical protein
LLSTLCSTMQFGNEQSKFTDTGGLHLPDFGRVDLLTFTDN